MPFNLFPVSLILPRGPSFPLPAATLQLVTTVKGIAEEAKGKLRSKLMNMSIRISEREKIIEYLRQLDPESNPAYVTTESVRVGLGGYVQEGDARKFVVARKTNERREHNGGDFSVEHVLLESLCRFGLCIALVLP